MKLPVQPTLTDFGLSEDDLALLPKPRIKNIESRYSVFLGIIIFVSISWYFFHHDHILVSLSLIALFGIVIAIPIVIVLTMLFAIAASLEQRYYCAISDTYKRFIAYSEECAGYEKIKKEYDQWLRKGKEDYWRSLSGVAFEEELGKLFVMMGFSVTQTPRTGDGGVDLLVRKNGWLTVVQCKAHNKRIPIGVARELSASMADFRANDAIIACFEGVTKPVLEYIKNKPIKVLTVGQIVELQRLHGNYSDTLLD